MTEPQSGPAPTGWGRGALISAALLGALALAVIAPPALSTGWNLEEIGGMLPAAPTWEYPGDEPPASELGPADGLRAYREGRYPLTLPVWGVMNGDDFYPLMIDGHIGALPGYPYRALFAWFGPNGPRILVLLTGLAMALSTFALGRAIFGTGAGVLATLLLVTTPLYAFTYTWNNHSEQWSAGFPALALLAAIHFARTRRTRWLMLGSLLAGAAVASKNTAVWTLFAGLIATGVFRMWPRVSARQVVGAIACACLPMLPQFAMIALSPSSRTLSERVGRIPMPWEAFAPERVANIAANYVEAFLSWTDYVTPFVRPALPLSQLEVPLLPQALLVGTVLAALLFVVRRLARPIRAFSLGFGLLVLQYMAFYYTGQSAFMLLVMWVPLGLAGVMWLAIERAWRARLAAVRWGVPALLFVLYGGFLYNNAVETDLYERSTTQATAALWNREAQMSLAEELLERDIPRPWTMSFAFGGVLEMLSDGALRPHHAYPLFATVCADAEHLAQRDAWLEVFARMGPGRHHVVLNPTGSKVELSPCRTAEPIMLGFDEALESAGVGAELVRSWVSDDGTESFRLVAVDVPAAPAEVE